MPACRRTILILLFSLFLAGSGEVSAKQVVVLIGGISLADVANHQPEFLLREVLPSSALGLINSRTGGAYSPENCYASLGWGARVQVPETGRFFQELDAASFRRYRGSFPALRESGSELPKGFAVYFGSLLRSLSKIPYSVQPGLLGQALAEAGHPPALLGSGDSLEEAYRASGLLTMDFTGLLPAVDFTTSTVTDPAYPGGLKADFTALQQRLVWALSLYDVVFVETGNFLRLYAESDLLTPGAVEKWKATLLEELDQFLAELAGVTLPPDTQYWLVSAYPGKDAYRSGNPVTFLATWGRHVLPGLLTSPTTRTSGLITNTDFAPTLASAQGMQLDGAYGSVATTAEHSGDRISYLIELNRTWVAANSFRAPFLKSYVLFQILVVTLGILYLIWPKFRLGLGLRLNRVLKSLYLAVTLAPVLLLSISLLPPNWFTYFLVIFVIPVLASYLVSNSRVLPIFAAVYLATSGLILADALSGWGLASKSLLGYDPIGGARFYGIGNEYMGVLIGSFFMGWSALLEHFWNNRFLEKIMLLAMVTVLIVLGSPAWGANVGGTLGIAAAIGTWLILGAGRRHRAKFLVLAGVLALLTLTAFAWWDLTFSHSPSHLGRFAQQVADRGISGITEVFSRKLAMNWKLLHYTIWADGLLSFIAGLGLLFWRPIGLPKQLQEKHPRIIRGFWTTLSSAVVVLIANDSGVVATATLMIYPTFILLALASQDTG